MKRLFFILLSIILSIIGPFLSKLPVAAEGNAAKYNINLFKSYYIGDDTRDIIAGNMAGCKTFLANSRNSLYSIVSKYL